MSKYLDSTGLSYFWGKIKAFVMGGATGSAAGSAGLVPAPAAGDEGKYLKGDGTWNAVAVPTKTSQLTNDSGFLTDAGVTSFNGSTGAVTYSAPVTSVNGNTGAVTVGAGAEVTLSASSWNNKTQSVSVSGVTSSSRVVVTPKYGSIDSYVAAEIYCTGQGTNSLTFACVTVPTATLTVNVLIL